MSPQSSIGHFRIVSKLGEGGMGAVYRASDTKLGRDVALKILPDSFIADAVRTARFAREAQVLASLNHPNIAAIYGVEERALVLELVEGRTLADRIERGAIPLEEALAIGGEIAEALEYAHERGIIHRDLKPANVKVTAEGRVKVLDFGLAKALGNDPAATDPASSPTLTMCATVAGTIIGTAAYMSPEQARGKPVDRRADIWAFGVVLFELLTGKRLFGGGGSASDAIAAVLTREPDFAALPKGTPSRVRRILELCLRKDARLRMRDMGDVRLLLDEPEWVSQSVPGAPRSAETTTKKLRLWQGIAALMTLIALGFAARTLWPHAATTAHRITFQVSIPESPEEFEFLSLSPDGRKLVVAGHESQDVLWIRDLETLEWRQLAGTEGGGTPFWSPDSRFLAFGVRNQLKKIDLAGGPAQTLCTVSTIATGSGVWNQQGVILFGSRNFGSGGPIWKISQAGGSPEAITSVDTSRGELLHSQPAFLPDGKHFLYFRAGPPEVEGSYAGSLDSALGEQSRERILAGSFGASYVNGYLFFMRENTLMAQPFDVDRRQLRGEPVAVAGNVSTTWYNTGIFSVSPSGALAYRAGSRIGNRQLTWFDRQGKTQGTFGQPNGDVRISLSPDGTHGLVLDNPYGQADLWTLDFARGSRTRFTFSGRTPVTYGPAGVWSPDGSRIAFSTGSLLDAIYEKPSSGAGDEKELFREPNRTHFPTSWSRDGRFLLIVATNTPKTGDDVWVLPLQGDRKPVLLLGGPFNEWAATFSPDMRWIAYNSNEAGRAEVYVRPFLAEGPLGVPSLGDGKWQVSKDGGRFPRWSADGKEIFFEDTPTGTGKMAVEVKTSGAVFEYGTPHLLFRRLGGLAWDVTPDGKRFVALAPVVQQADQVPITVVLNWQAGLKK
ncbi:MAG TPA: protein kinase [Bryobacteraceae bacterium]|nr:protein kinase [Bryobacteraceae bacterium]